MIVRRKSLNREFEAIPGYHDTQVRSTFKLGYNCVTQDEVGTRIAMAMPATQPLFFLGNGHVINRHGKIACTKKSLSLSV
jgi:hypothetical protein